MKNNPKIWLSSPHMGDYERIFVNDSFESNWIAPVGPQLTNFEKDLCSYTGIKHAVALNSGTSAIHLALILFGVGPGDFVLCQSLTFAASANPIVYQGATPVFIDSEIDTWNMDPGLLEESIIELTTKGPSAQAGRRKPKAIIVVDLYGMPAKMDKILEIALKYEIPVIEDAAEALGSMIYDRMCGTFGKLNILSFNGNKIITTSCGGALLSNDKELINRAIFLANQSRDDTVYYQHSQIGYNYRLSNILAGIGRGQMIVLPERVNKRRDNFNRYYNYFNDINKKGYQIKMQEEPLGYNSNRWLTTILIEMELNKGNTSEGLRLALEKENIDARPIWKPMHLQPLYSGSPFYGNGISEKLFEDGLCLPSGSNLTDQDFDRIFTVMDKVFF